MLLLSLLESRSGLGFEDAKDWKRGEEKGRGLRIGERKGFGGKREGRRDRIGRGLGMGMVMCMVLNNIVPACTQRRRLWHLEV